MKTDLSVWKTPVTVGLTAMLTCAGAIWLAIEVLKNFDAEPTFSSGVVKVGLFAACSFAFGLLAVVYWMKSRIEKLTRRSGPISFEDSLIESLNGALQ